VGEEFVAGVEKYEMISFMGNELQIKFWLSVEPAVTVESLL
jgi:hypothetical protein